MRKLRTVVEKPQSLLIKLLYVLSPILNDRFYLRLLFPLWVGYRLDLKKPKTYNAKLQWLKLNYRDKKLCVWVDKYEVKNAVSRIIGEEHVVENYGVWDFFDTINFDDLPNQFVLKTTHDQGGVVICKDKSSFDIESARQKINRHLKKNVYYRYREWPYKNVKPRIIAEEYLVAEHQKELSDYKFFCFHGEPKIMFIATERQTGDVKFNFFDLDFNSLNIVQAHEQSRAQFEKPDHFALMIDLARQLSQSFPHVRIDFYNINGRILFGESTFFHHGGFQPFNPKNWDYELGDWLVLDELKK